MDKNIVIKLVNSWAEQDIVSLYKMGGWWKESYDSSLVHTMITGSFVFAVVVDSGKDKTIGMGRVISDGISDAYIQDLIVDPSYRKQGIGKQLVDTLISHCKTSGIVWIGVIAEPGSHEFYHRLGFSEMKDNIPMLYSREDDDASP